MIRSSSAETFEKEVGDLVGSAPDLFATEFLEILSFIGTFFRNGKIHPVPDSPWNFTTLEEIGVLRKLALGLDEGNVEPRLLLDRIENARWLPETERQTLHKSISDRWRNYPGLVSIIWKAVDSGKLV